MKIKVTFEVDTPAEAREILRAVEGLAKAPYRMEGFGTSIVKETPPVRMEVPALPEADMSASAPELVPVTEDAKIWTVEPPGDVVSKIGRETQDGILAALKDGPLPVMAINNALKRSPSMLEATKSSLALMWRRHFLQYDGAEYRINPKIGDL